MPSNKDTMTKSSSSTKEGSSTGATEDEDFSKMGVTYGTLDKGPKRVRQYVLGEILGEGIIVVVITSMINLQN